MHWYGKLYCDYISDDIIQKRGIQFNLLDKFIKTDRSSLPDVFCKKRVLRKFSKLTEKHLWQSLFFNKVAGLSPATLLKKDSCTGVFL